MLLPDLLRRSVAARPDHPAVIDRERVLTYGALERRSNQVAHLLRMNGVNRADRVLLALDNSIEFVASYFGILKAGAIVVPVAPGPHNDRLHPAVDDCTPAGCIGDPFTLQALQNRRTVGCGARFVVRRGGTQSESEFPDFDAAVDKLPETSLPSDAIDLDLAAIIYTSGSTGRPRGVMLSHLNFVANARSIVSYLGLEPFDRVMAVLPFHYVYGLSLLHTHIMVGGTLVVENGFTFPNVVVGAMKHHEVTGLAGVPSTFAILLRRSALPRTKLPSLRYVTQAGGPMPPALVREWRAAMPSVPLVLMYGATEAAARLAYLEPAEVDRRIGSIGRAIPNVELRILREDGTVAAPGESGELVARGSNIACGYWNAPDESHERFTPLGYHTGDIGYMDADGFIYLVGRKHDMLKVGAHRVSAAEIEAVLCDHLHVHEAAVVPVAHELLGEAPAAYVSLREGAVVPAGDLIMFCRGRLPEYKVPGQVTVLPELPKTVSGKVDRAQLRAAAGRQPAIA